MGKDKYALKKIITFLLFTIISLHSKNLYSQCTNLPPTGDAIQTFCKVENSTITDLVASGGTIVWFNAPTGGTQYSNATPLLNGVTYYADDVDSGNCSTSRLEVTVFIYGNLPTNVDVYVGKCASENPTIADLSATGTNIEWYDAQVNGNLLTNSEPLTNGTTYWVQQTENGCTSDRLPTTVNLVNPEPPVVDEVQSFCYPPNPTIADLQPSGSTVVWYADEFSTIPLELSTPLENGIEYWATTYAFPCESTIRTKTTVVLDEAPNAGTDASYTECEIDFVTINLFDLLGPSANTSGTWTGPSTLSNGYLGTFEPGINLEGDYTYTVSTTLGICPNATAVVSVTIQKTSPPSTSNSTQFFCEIDNPTIADLSVVGNNILWYDTETSTTPLNTSDALVDGEDYWASQTETTSGCESATRLMVTATIQTILPPTTSETNQVFCEIQNPTVGNLNVSGTGILWYDSETSTTPLNTTDALVNGEDYWASQTNATSGCESERLAINVVINNPSPPIVNEINQTFCVNDFLPANPTIDDLDIIGTSILWYDTETSTTPLNTTDALVDGEDYWASQTDATSGCESANRVVITVSIVNPAIPTTSNTNQSFCAENHPTISFLQASGTNIVWYEDETSTTPLLPTAALIDGEDYWAEASDSSTGCVSISRLMVTATINNVAPATVTNVSQIFCASDNPTIENLEAEGNGIIWFASEIETTPLNASTQLINGEDYWAAQTNSSTGCASEIRTVVNVTLTNPGTPNISSLGNEFCKIDKPTLAELNENVSPINGGIITWYNSYPNGSQLNLSELLIEGETYYAIETNSDGCSSTNPLEVTVSLESCDEYDVEIYDGFSPTGNGINDTFKLGNLRDLYPNFQVEFFNRWGNLIYTANASKPDWNGRLNGDGELVPAGVYYFIIYFNKENRKPIQRRLYLSR